jgi:hypothetical protein
MGTLLAKEVWKKKPYVEWTQQEAVALLTDSPWSVNQPVRGASPNLAQSSSAPREGSATCEEVTLGNMDAGAEEAVAKTAASASALSSGPRFYTVRFVSARPVREAIARWAILNGRILPSQAQAMLTQDPYNGSIVVSMSASNDEDWLELNSFSTEALEEANYLLLKKSKRKIFAERYVPPVESGIGEALFYFSRADGITPAEKGVAFNCRLSGRTQFRTEFKLKKMVIDGELAI